MVGSKSSCNNNLNYNTNDNWLLIIKENDNGNNNINHYLLKIIQNERKCTKKKFKIF